MRHHLFGSSTPKVAETEDAARSATAPTGRTIIIAMSIDGTRVAPNRPPGRAIARALRQASARPKAAMRIASSSPRTGSSLGRRATLRHSSPLSSSSWGMATIRRSSGRWPRETAPTAAGWQVGWASICSPPRRLSPRASGLHSPVLLGRELGAAPARAGLPGQRGAQGHMTRLSHSRSAKAVGRRQSGVGSLRPTLGDLGARSGRASSGCASRGGT